MGSIGSAAAPVWCVARMRPRTATVVTRAIAHTAAMYAAATHPLSDVVQGARSGINEAAYCIGQGLLGRSSP